MNRVALLSLLAIAISAWDGALAQTRVAAPMFYVDGFVRPEGATPNTYMTNMIFVDCYNYAQPGLADPVQKARQAATEIVTRIENPDLAQRDLDRDTVCILLHSFGHEAELPGEPGSSRGHPRIITLSADFGCRFRNPCHVGW